MNLCPEAAAVVAEIEAEGWTVEFKEYCEDAETPGFLGQIAGVTVHGRKAVKVRSTLPSGDMVAVLRHELAHIRGERPAEHPGYACGGDHVNVFGEDVRLRGIVGETGEP